MQRHWLHGHRVPAGPRFAFNVNLLGNMLRLHHLSLPQALLLCMLSTIALAKFLHKRNVLCMNTVHRLDGSRYSLDTFQAGTYEQLAGSTRCKENHFNARSSVLPVEAEEVGWGLRNYLGLSQ